MYLVVVCVDFDQLAGGLFLFSHRRAVGNAEPSGR